MAFEIKLQGEMSRHKTVSLFLLIVAAFLSSCSGPQAEPLLDAPGHKSIKLDYNINDKILLVKHPLLGEKPLKIWAMEAYCRKGSTCRNWSETTIEQKNEVVSKSPHQIKVRTSLASGAQVQHRFAVVADEILFESTITNMTNQPVDIEWMAPCIRVGDFTGLDKIEYIRKCFIFTDKGLTRLHETKRAEDGFYKGGQVYVPACINRNDVNPRPLSPDIPTKRLIGCFSADEKILLATAWTDVQELFQGIYACIHADPRIGGLGPNQTKKIWGKLYIIPNDMDELLRRYHRDFGR
jgi:hypothetical protein